MGNPAMVSLGDAMFFGFVACVLVDILTSSLGYMAGQLEVLKSKNCKVAESEASR